MICVETNELLIKPLSGDDINLYLKSEKLLEKKLGLNYSNEKLSYEMKKMLAEILQIIELENDYLWDTNWLIISKKENIIIGGFLFKGSPNKYGEVEVGYSINERFRNKGYMRNALMAMLKWAFSKDYVTSIVAETRKDNIASQKVLTKVGMKKYRTTKEYFWYKINKKR